MDYLKLNKLSYRVILSLSLILSIFTTSCSDNFVNQDEKGLTQEQLRIDANEGGMLLPGMMSNILAVNEPWNYEFQQNLSIDHYSGYVSFPAPFFGNQTNATYRMVTQWNDGIWAIPSSRILDQWVVMKKNGYEEQYPDLFAVATIVKVFAGHRLVDTFGSIPYSLYGTAAEVEFDSGEESYNLFFEELKQAVEVLTLAEDENPGSWQVRFTKFDQSEYGGDYQKWIRLANTLRLRLAIRISNVNPEQARIEAEAAVESGVLTGSDGSFGVKASSRHPLDIITKDWQETRLGAPVETILSGYNDPRLQEYGLPATHPDVVGQIKGARTGVPFPTNDAYMPFSQLNLEGNPPVKFMDVSESYFLRAEGVLRGWDMGGGTSKDFYEQGIAVSFDENRVGGIDNYLSDNTSTPISYIDPVNSDNNADPLTSITIQWDEGATREQKMERIITQKWIAMFPEGMEAWSEFRRTGYPKLYPIRVNESEGQVADGEFIKRMNYPANMRNSSPGAIANAISNNLNGGDRLSTKIWWDVK